MQGVEGSSYIPSERRYLPNSSVLRKAVGEKDTYTILHLIQTSKDKERVRKLMEKELCVVPGKTFKKLIDELEELRWLKPIKESKKN